MATLDLFKHALQVPGTKWWRYEKRENVQITPGKAIRLIETHECVDT